jgi:hypothetical protein
MPVYLLLYHELKYFKLGNGLPVQVGFIATSGSRDEKTDGQQDSDKKNAQKGKKDFQVKALDCHGQNTLVMNPD